MPYIKPERRAELDPIIDQFPELKVGDMGYVFARIVHRFIEDNGMSYATLSAAAATLSDCRTEFERQVIAPYEDKKKNENGAVSDLDSNTLEDVR